jgi:hypothetical protein
MRVFDRLRPRHPAPSLARYNEGAVSPTNRRISLAAEKNYQAEYLGSGTFVIRKPKRQKHKTRQSRLRNPERGSRK